MKTGLLWKASSYELTVVEFGQKQFIEASADATWSRQDTFDEFPDPDNKKIPAPYLRFLQLKNIWERPKQWRGLHRMIEVFAQNYNLIGIFNETYSGPVLPPSEDFQRKWILPDSYIDDDKKLQYIDPGTEGKRRLEEALIQKRGRPNPGEPKKPRGPWTGNMKQTVKPQELSFRIETQTSQSKRFGHIDRVDNIHSWESVKSTYGLRAVLDKEADFCVTIISTREPLVAWETELEDFPWPKEFEPSALDYRLSGIEPCSARPEENNPILGWQCPTLLKAMYLMLRLDLESGHEVVKCQREGCDNYFRKRQGNNKRKYCPHPDDPKKQSKCGSRVASSNHYKRNGRN